VTAEAKVKARGYEILMMLVQNHAAGLIQHSFQGGSVTVYKALFKACMIKKRILFSTKIATPNLSNLETGTRANLLDKQEKSREYETTLTLGDRKS
jgi:hypothetical protein